MAESRLASGLGDSPCSRRRYRLRCGKGNGETPGLTEVGRDDDQVSEKADAQGLTPREVAGRGGEFDTRLRSHPPFGLRGRACRAGRSRWLRIAFSTPPSSPVASIMLGIMILKFPEIANPYCFNPLNGLRRSAVVSFFSREPRELAAERIKPCSAFEKDSVEPAPTSERTPALEIAPSD